MFEFIIGPSGSGKSSLISRKIVDDLASGKKVILIVPEQTAMSSEDSICTEAQKRNVPQTELEILNFKRLCNRVFREYGGIAYNSVSKGARALILWKTLFSSAPFLSRYKAELEDAGQFIPLLLSTFSELKTYRITPSMLSETAEDIKNDDITLSEKLSELGIIYSLYEHLLSKNFSDPSDDLSRLSSLLKECDFFSGINLYIDSFSGFTPQEYSVLSSAFRQADNVTCALCFTDSEKDLAFSNVKDTYRELKKLAERHSTAIKITTLDKALRFNSPELEFLENNLWNIGDGKTFNGESKAIRTVTASGIYSEVEFVANDITSRIRNGASYRDFAVIARNINDYYGVIDAVFSDYELPCHISRRLELSEKPLFKLLLSALNIKNNGWNTEDVVIFMKTGLSPVTPDECDELESYAFQWNIFGKRWYDENDWFMNPEGYTDIMTEESKLALDRVNAIRKKVVYPLTKLFESFDGTRTIRELCNAVYDFMLELEVDKKISDTNDDDEIRIWNIFCDALDIIVDILPDTKADSVLFANLFTLVVNQTNVGNLPTVIDEITIGSADKVRTNKIKHVYILGVNEGIFPAACEQNGIFSDNDKCTLEEYGIILTPSSNITSVNELYYFYTSVTCASESVTVICSSKDSAGKSLKPSVAFLRVRDMFPGSERILTENLSLSNYIQNKNASFSICSLADNTPEAIALKRIYSECEEFSSLLDSDRQLLITVEEKLDEDTAKEIFGKDLSLTQSRLDSYVMCAFGYNCNYILKLKSKDRYEFKASDTGNLIHRILEKFFIAATDENGQIKDLTQNERYSLIDKITEEYVSAIFGSNKEKRMSERAVQLFLRLRRSVKILIDNLLEEFSQSEFVPRFFEMKINNSNLPNTVAPLQIPLPDGTSAYIYGVADRVDICKKGDDVYVRVVDYKTGSKDFSLSDISLGLNLQMLLYLFSIWKDRSGSFKKVTNTVGEIIPAGVLYCTAKAGDVSVSPETAEEEVLSAVADTLKRKGLLINDEEILRLMEKKLSGKYIPVTVKKDGELSSSLTLENLEGMGRLMQEISATVSKLASEMKCGNASARPLKNAKHDGCRFCPHKTICRNSNAFASN